MRTKSIAKIWELLAFVGSKLTRAEYAAKARAHDLLCAPCLTPEEALEVSRKLDRMRLIVGVLRVLRKIFQKNL